jgi:hypothetical protein
MATLLAKKSGAEDGAVAKTDDHHEALAADPSVSAFSSGTSFGSTNASTTTTTTFGSSTTTTTGGFGSPAAAGGFGATPPSGGFGAPAGSGTTGATMAQHNPADSLKSGGGAMSEGGESTVALDKDATDWINKKMRPMMGWIYMLTCTCDFVLFPVMWSVLQALTHGNVTSQWQPLTLQGAGLYHIAMGAVLGIAAYGRTKEKVAGVA